MFCLHSLSHFHFSAPLEAPVVLLTTGACVVGAGVGAGGVDEVVSLLNVDSQNFDGYP